MTSALADVAFWIAVFLLIQVANRLNIAACTQAIHDLRLTGAARCAAFDSV